MSKHTPTPWECVPSDLDDSILVYGPGPFTEGHIAEIHGQNTEANAAFILAAIEGAK